ncbi:MAG: Crp/Fnr family transcriptional regulator [Myxococcota bacterium]|nr:Crp/Fnr family transcriptional regulator [Myxococcota bacterium]
MSADALERAKLLSRYGRRIAAGTVLYRDGEPAEHAYLIEQGRVRLFKEIGGMERSLRLVRPGELFGESALTPGSVRASTALALDDLDALVFDASAFDEIVFTYPAVTQHVVAELVLRLREAEDQIEILRVSDARSKVLVALLKLAEHANGTASGSELRGLEISPLELSARIGLDVESVKRIVLGLKESGHLRIVDERVEIPDLDTLRELYSLLGVRDQLRGPERSQTFSGKTASP